MMRSVRPAWRTATLRVVCPPAPRRDRGEGGEHLKGLACEVSFAAIVSRLIESATNSKPINTAADVPATR
jgi:hypothetical protein